MKKIQAFQCDVCDSVIAVQEEMVTHEAECIQKFEYEKEKEQTQKMAAEYLDSFRGRAFSIPKLLDLIEGEMTKIRDAVKVLEYYGEDIELQECYDFSFEKTGFASVRNPHEQRMTHSSPVGKKQLSMLNYDGECPLAFDIRIAYKAEGKGKSFNVLDSIAGINTGTGGSCGNNGWYYYTTFWIEDYPLGLK
jgi:hypothetical protein